MKTAVLVSGGVDSSVALVRLAERGCHEVEAFYLKIWLEDEMAFLGTCPWEDDLRYARDLCRRVGVPLHVIPLQREYHQRVVAHAVKELKAGRTPSPDVLCNQQIKFGAFVDAIDADTAVASGHHARLVTEGSTPHLLKGIDPVKDQTYFLCLLEADQLARCRFPIGEMMKTEIRDLARARGLSAADRPDSQGICFLGRVPYADFIHFHLGERDGDIRNIADGSRLGKHRGYWYYTIGQRRGLGLAGGPWYVVGKEISDNVVWVSHGDGLATHCRDIVEVHSPNWFAGPPIDQALEVKLRHGPNVIPCRVEIDSTGAVRATLAEPDSGVAAGQFAVFYSGSRCLGGGAITEPSQCP